MVLVTLIESVYNFLWGDLLTLPLGGVTLNLSLMVILLFTAGIYFTLRTRLLPMRLFRDMLDAVCEKKQGKQGGLSSLQTLVVSTATRVGMGNLVGVVAAVSVGGAGAVFWMWVTALLGASTSFVESTLAQKYKEPDPLYGAAARHFICTSWQNASGGNCSKNLLWHRCLRCPDSSAGAASARLSATR